MDAETAARAKLEFKIKNDQTTTTAMIANMTEKVFNLERQLSVEHSSKMKLFSELAELQDKFSQLTGGEPVSSRMDTTPTAAGKKKFGFF